MARSNLVEELGTLALARRRCWGIFDWLCKLYIILFKPPKRGDPCLYIPEHIINRPDPCIYSQFLLMQLDQPVTWDNPDVAIFLDGIEQYTYDLTVDTEYRIEITVHNSSRKKPANGTQVAVRWIEFGAGSQIRHPIATLSTDVPVWPAVAIVNTTWRTPATPGHYCIEVELSHPEDGNPANNRGWNNTQVKAAASEVQVPIRIFNRWLEGCPPIEEGGRKVTVVPILLGWAVLGAVAGFFTVSLGQTAAQTWLLALGAVAGYLAGFLIGFTVEGVLAWSYRKKTRKRTRRDEINCNLVELTLDSYIYHDQKGKDADPDVMFAPRPPAWGARVEPHLFHFGENETFRDVHLIVDAPDEPSSSEVFNVNARQGGAPSGGVTVTIIRGQGG